MGRSGSGGGGRSSGMSHSSGSRGFSRSGGSSSRSGAGSSSRSGGSSGFNSFNSFRPSRTTVYHRSFHYGPSVGYHREIPVGRAGGGIIAGFFSLVVIIFLVAVFIIIASSQFSKPQSTINREKLNSGNAFVNGCIVDELGWVNNQSKMKKGMEQFWRETGVQPWVVLTYETSETSTDTGREAWTQQYYDTHCDSDTFLYVYFETGNSSVKGPDCVWWGNMSASVMDDEAVNIFLNYLDSYWETWDADDTAGMFAQIFTKTGETIMKVSTTGKDIMKWMVILSVVVVLLVGFVVIFNMKRAAERARAEETERILQAGQNQQTFDSDDSDMDDLTSRYD